MSIDIEDLGSCVFEELVFDYLAYNPLLSEARVVDHYEVDRETRRVVLYVNEISKTPYRVVLETKVVSCEKEW